MTLQILPATLADLDALEALEKRTFDTDRLSRRSLRRWLTSEHRAFLKADLDGELVGVASYAELAGQLKPVAAR